jgi:hypothetical protein
MIKNIILILFLSCQIFLGQKNLDYYIGKALENSPSLNQFQNERAIAKLQNKLDEAQNSAFQISLTGDYLFAPFFNNSNGLISADPDSKAIGYDVGITNGGLYSAQVNVQKNIFNGNLLDLLNKKNELSDKGISNEIKIEEHNIRKNVTEQYLGCIQFLKLYELAKENSGNINKQLAIIKTQIEKGFVKVQDYLLLKIECKNQNSMTNEAWRNYKSGLIQLNSLCGIQDSSTVDLETTNLIKTSKNSESNFTSKYSIDSMLIINQQDLFENKYKPQVSVFMNTGLNAVDLEYMERKFGLSAGINLSLPLFDGNQKDITRQQNEIYGLNIRQNKDFLQKNLFLQRQNGLERMKSTKASLESILDQIKDYDQVIQLSQKQVEQGSMNMIEYLTIIKNHIELLKNKITAEINYQLEINNYNYWNW